MPKPPLLHRSVGLIPDDARRLEQIAVERGSTVSDVIREAVREWLARQERYRRSLGVAQPH